MNFPGEKETEAKTRESQYQKTRDTERNTDGKEEWEKYPVGKPRPNLNDDDEWKRRKWGSARSNAGYEEAGWDGKKRQEPSKSA